MSTDRELLERAAKAVGYKHTQWSPLQHHTVRWGVCTTDGIWNPLTDDGDALRLAVKIGISGREPVRICIEYQHDGEQDFTCIEHRGETTQWHLDDPYAATRRAIVRAAAEIGKEQK